MKKIAIVRRNGLGDLICALPLVRYLRQQGAQITLFVDQRNHVLLPYIPEACETVVLPSGGNKYLQLLKVARRYRKERFDVAISAKTSPMKLMNCFLFALGAQERIAAVDQRWHRRLINSPRLYDPQASMQTHQALKCLRLVAPEMTALSPSLYPSLRVAGKAETSLPGPYLVISATTTRPESRFTPERYADIVNRIDRPCSVLILSQQAERPRAEAIARRLTLPHEVIVPDSFATFMLWLNLSDLYFIGDGGIGHLGAALGKPGVVAYGDETTCPQWHPLSEQVKTFSHAKGVNAIPSEQLVTALQGFYDARKNL